MSDDGRDEEAVRALVCAYAELLDAGDLDGVAALFDHGSFRSARDGSLRSGRAEVRAMYDSVIIYEDGTPHTRHVLGNIEVRVDGASAASSCTFTVLQAGADGRSVAPVLAGRYVDRLERVAGAWRFAERVVHPDLVGDLRLHMGRERR